VIKPEDIEAMNLFVAQAVHREAVGDDEERWENLTADEQAQFRFIAHAAMGAHDGFLLTRGYVISKVEQTAGAGQQLVTPQRKLIRPN
jgi:hypothetical protein